MMRAVLLAAIMGLGAACAAAAQPFHADPNRPSSAQQDYRMAQRDGVRPQLDGQTAQDRDGDEPRLDDPGGQWRAAGDAINIPSIQSGARIDAHLSADAERIDQLMEAAMARSNARVLAVRPVTR